MRIFKIITLVGLLSMTAVLIYGFTAGDFIAEGSKLISMPWGIVSLVDLYVGFILFSGWILYREGINLKSILWTVLMMILGFWTGALYTYLALQSSNEDWWQFWHGKKGMKNRNYG